MKRFVTAMAAFAIALGGFAAFGSGDGTPTIQTHTIGNKTYLVDGDGKLLYIFVPSGVRAIPIAHDWREPTRTWVQNWRPFELNEGESLELDAEAFEGHVFETLPKVREHGITHHVQWGGAGTDDVPFWGLYTFEGDDRLDTYSLEDGDYPPGWVFGIWHPATADGAPEPSNPNLIPITSSFIGEGSGNTAWGGP